jgi:hypothetical protein
VGYKFVFNPLSGQFDTVQDVSGFVPYTEATGDLELGSTNSVYARSLYLYDGPGDFYTNIRTGDSSIVFETPLTKADIEAKVGLFDSLIQATYLQTLTEDGFFAVGTQSEANEWILSYNNVPLITVNPAGTMLLTDGYGSAASIGPYGINFQNDIGTYFSVTTSAVFIGDGYPCPMDLIVSSYLSGNADALTVRAALSRVGIRNTSPNQPLDVVGTVRIGYNTTNHLEISSSSTGLITYNATGTGSAHYFADAIRATNHINFDATIGDSGYGFRSNSGTMQFKNSGGSWQDIAKGSKTLTANFQTTNTTATNTNLSFPIAANETFKVRVTGTASKATTATGLKLAVAAPTGCTIKGVQYGGGATLIAPLVPSLITAINTLGTTFATGIGVEVGFVLEFVVTNSSTAGNITLQAATVTSNQLTIYAGTTMQYEPYVGV